MIHLQTHTSQVLINETSFFICSFNGKDQSHFNRNAFQHPCFFMALYSQNTLLNFTLVLTFPLEYI